MLTGNAINPMQPTSPPTTVFLPPACEHSDQCWDWGIDPPATVPAAGPAPSLIQTDYPGWTVQTAWTDTIQNAG